MHRLALTHRVAALAMLSISAQACIASPPNAPRRILRTAESPRAPAADPFVWHDLVAGLTQRKQRAADMNALAQKTRQRAWVLASRLERGEISKVNFDMSMHKLRQDALAESMHIMYSLDDAHARQRYIEDFGCVKCTKDALSAIKRLGVKVVELGAGAGHWERALALAGVDVVSYDSFASLPSKLVGNVAKGDESVLAAHPNRALLLVYPPASDMAVKCVKAYAGDLLVYVGEGRGGANANAEFFDLLLQDWAVQEMVILEETFPACYERLFVLRRRR
jgi:hypothetical protein